MASFLQNFGKYILMVVIALLSFLSGSVTDIGQAVQIAINKDKAITQAVEIINDTPEAQIKAAVIAEGKPDVVSTSEAAKANDTAHDVTE